MPLTFLEFYRTCKVHWGIASGASRRRTLLDPASLPLPIATGDSPPTPCASSGPEECMTRIGKGWNADKGCFRLAQ